MIDMSKTLILFSEFDHQTKSNRERREKRRKVNPEPVDLTADGSGEDGEVIRDFKLFLFARNGHTQKCKFTTSIGS